MIYLIIYRAVKSCYLKDVLQEGVQDPTVIRRPYHEHGGKRIQSLPRLFFKYILTVQLLTYMAQVTFQIHTVFILGFHSQRGIR